MNNALILNNKALQAVKNGDKYFGISTYYIDNGIAKPRSTMIFTPETFKGVKRIPSTSSLQAIFFTRTLSGQIIFPDLEIVEQGGFEHAFDSTILESTPSFPKLKRIDRWGAIYMFADQMGVGSPITHLIFPALKSIGEAAFAFAFAGNKNLESIEFPELTTAGSEGFLAAFDGCTSLKTLSFPKLTDLTASEAMTYAFQETSLENVYFPALTSNSFGNNTNQFTSLLAENCTFHFPSNLLPTISKLQGYPIFDSTNLTLLFDLEATW